MTKDEFQSLKVGDSVKYMNTVLHIIMVESEYDYSVSPTKCNTWKVHYSEGTNNQVDDSIVKFLKKMGQY